VALTVELTVKLLERIAALPPSEDTEAALHFLKQSDLTQIIPAEEQLSYSPAQYWLRIYKIKRETSIKAGITTYGFSSLLLALEKLPPSEPLAITALAANEWWGVFWLDQSHQLIGFVLVKRRSEAMAAADIWSKTDNDILAPELLAKIRDVLETEPIILEHRLYAGSSAPLRLVFDDYEDFLNHLKSRAQAGDHLLIWGYSSLCRNDNVLMDAKCPDDAGRTPRGGSY
jgi:hypothetical protein